jgi:hypothetical protein
VCYLLPVSRILIAALLAAVAVSQSSCQRPSGEQCERLCWRYNELNYWKQFDAETRELAPDARAKRRSEREKEWAAMRARNFDPGLDNCVRNCRRSASPGDVECVEKATTAEQAADCLD